MKCILPPGDRGMHFMSNTRRPGGWGAKFTEQTWDDSNALNGDGCSSTWTVEFEYSWTTTSPSVWTKLWGNGVINTSEACDDCNTSNGDGWSSTWTVETGYSWSGSPSSCSVKCGDGLIIGSEKWDDKNTSSGDGWSSKCEVESNYSWSGQPSSWTISVQINNLSTLIGSVIQGLFGLSNVISNKI